MPSSASQIRLVGYVDDATRLELSHDLAHAILPILHAPLRVEDLLAIRREVRHDALVAIVGERGQVNLDWAIALVEQCLFAPRIPNGADASAEEHQIALLGRKDGIVPI